MLPSTTAENYVIGQNINRKVHTSNTPPAFKSPEILKSSDENLEATIFPHLFPDGFGSWHKEKNALTLGQYHKHRPQMGK